MTAPVDPNLFILSRPDGRRVFHLGVLGPLPKDQDAAVCHHLGPYTDRGVDVPAHWWNAEVTDRTNCPVKIIRTPADLVAANRMFPYGNTGVVVEPQPPRVPYKQMGSSSVQIGMPITGERPDIGDETDNAGYFMLGFDPNPMVDWAMAIGSCPMHYRDEATGRPVDLVKYPTANCYSGYQGGPHLAKGPLVPDASGNKWETFGGGWVPQQAHWPEACYAAHMATLDLGFLEDLQYSANFTVLCDAYVSYLMGEATVSGEYRGVAWALRNLFMAHVASQDLAARCTAQGVPYPDYLQPPSYWKRLLDDALALYGQSMTNPSRQALRIVAPMVQAGDPLPGTAVSPDVLPPWQCDYMLTALAFGVLTGHTDWQPLYVWALKNVYDRTSGDDMPVGIGGFYYVLGNSPNWKTAILNGVPGLGGAEPASPTELAKLNADPYNGGSPLRNPWYLCETRAALVMAQYLHLKGILDIKTTYPKLDICVQNVDRMLRSAAADPAYRLAMSPRTSVVTDASQAPSTVPPLTPPVTPPPTKPPAGALHMSGNGNLAVGQSAPFVLSYDDGHGNPSQPPVNLKASVTPPGSVTVDLINSTMTGAAHADSFTVEFDADNCTPASLSGSVALPLAGALHAVWG